MEVYKDHKVSDLQQNVLILNEVKGDEVGVDSAKNTVLRVPDHLSLLSPHEALESRINSMLQVKFHLIVKMRSMISM